LRDDRVASAGSVLCPEVREEEEMSVHRSNHHGLEEDVVSPWSTALPMLLIVALIFLSPVIFDVCRSLSLFITGK